MGSNIPPHGLRFSFAYVLDKEAKTVSWEPLWSLKYIPAQVHVEVDTVSAGKDNEKNTLTHERNILIPPGRLGEKSDGTKTQ